MLSGWLRHEREGMMIPLVRVSILRSTERNSALSEMEAYSQSKLALTMWSFYVAVVEPGLNVIAVNPGSLLALYLVETNTKMIKEGFGYQWPPADKGRDILFSVAVSEKYENA